GVRAGAVRTRAAWILLRRQLRRVCMRRELRKVLIAGRGEIAVRIARACRDAGLVSVAVYADPVDRAARHVRAADRAVPLPAQTPARTSLDPARMLRAAVASGADALHPGYGPLAEDADFAQAVLD